MDMAIDTGIFDYANVNFMSSSLPALSPADLKTKGAVSWHALHYGTLRSDRQAYVSIQ